MPISCYFCHKTNQEKNVRFHLVSKTTKRSMCDDCYSQYKAVAIVPIITDEDIKKIEDEEYEDRKNRNQT